MKKFYYQVKTKNNEDYGWSCYPSIRGLVDAEDIKTARKIVKEEILDNDCDKKNGILLTLIEIKPDSEYLIDLCAIHTCKRCGKKFSFNETQYPSSFCSEDCRDEHRWEEREKSESNWIGTDEGCMPVIYMIENVINGKKYVGQTIRAFTLRWWEHFHAWVKKQEEGVESFKFSILEVVEKTYGQADVTKQRLDEREQFYINKFDAIENGYNSRNQTKNGEVKVES